MKEGPILFQGAMIRAILSGQKTQTRRIVKLPHQNSLGVWEPHRIGGPNGGRLADGSTLPEQGALWHTRTGDSIMCPKGGPGDRLWVRESLAATRQAGVDCTGAPKIVDYHYAADGVKVPRCPDLAPEFNDGMAFAHLVRPGGVPSIHMPRWASRITLEITSVRVERLQAISEADAQAEGVERIDSVGGMKLREEFYGWRAYGDEETQTCLTAAASFRCLWKQINGAESWDANPWVWVVEFKKMGA